ncbi:TonB-dependent receptor plug domain-containing protein [Sphingomonas psychrotolerans]|uniref:TonB-dependent receptor plug domain-containing protein n=1 Tax=Sphingomonas psychrotolerans TaxID=1327635 RepID=A0A2K8MAZ3_9SPHN|nr:TonB-dependent receptor plug domain-containing protein [Sphingomonas psychrotolerans]ATY31055.1 hypothetical protein CVN68_02875 [Sphingomonas psychrotolerans]
MPAFQAGEETAQRRSDIVVTGIRDDDSYAPAEATVAGKSPALLLKIPQSVSVITRQQIEDPNLFTIGEAMQEVTGVTVMPFDGSYPDYRARGSCSITPMTASPRPFSQAFPSSTSPFMSGSRSSAGRGAYSAARARPAARPRQQVRF